jgi:hypothetical protein
MLSFPDGNTEHVTRKVTARQQFPTFADLASRPVIEVSESRGLVGLQGIVSIEEKASFRKLPATRVPGTLSEASKRLLRRPSVPALKRYRPYAATRLQSRLQ